MLRVECDLVGVSPVSFSKAVQSVKNKGENHDKFEDRTWMERLHVDAKNQAFIPAMALKNTLSAAAKFRSEKIPGRGQETYTKNFEVGIMVVDNIMLGVDKSKVKGERVFVPANGKRGGGSRVWKTFPIIPEWSGHAIIHVIDPVLIENSEKVKEYLDLAGQLIGLLRFRPRNNGYYGRFRVENFRVMKS